MKIEWLGHSCFLLTSAEGVRILIDPFNPEIGYPAPSVEADIVTTSHQHSDHNYVEAVKGPYTLINQPGSYSEHGVQIKGVATFHDEAQGAKRGSNIVFRYSVDGLNIVHCGDLGHPLSAAQVAEIGAVDVLLVPVGGYYTIDSATALGVVQALKPALTIPMHFKTPSIDYPITTFEPFLEAAGGGKQVHSRAVQVTKETLEELRGVLVLDYPR